MNAQVRAILWAQARMIWNYLPRARKSGLAFSIIISVVWYGMWCAFATLAVRIFSDPSDPKIMGIMLSGAMVLVFLYWQVIPVLMATTGASLEIKKLRVYPIPHSQLFSIEVLLRITTGIEMVLILGGIGLGLELNRMVPVWSPPALLLYIAFNLCCAAGMREILARVFARKRVREIAVFFLVLCGALPQLFVVNGGHTRMGAWVQGYNAWWLPWSAASMSAQALTPVRSFATLLAWTLGAYAFGRWQFERGLRFDADAARATEVTQRGANSWSEGFFRWPSRVFTDPLAAMVEKELRFLSRAPRFRLVFTMGFTFGLIIWLPIAGRGMGGDGFMANNYLTLVCAYALLLLGDVCFWNIFGFDRRAAQMYFVAPVRFSTVLVAKNIAALFYVLLEITAILTVCAVLRMPVTPSKLFEAYSVTLVITLYLVAVGNLTSTHNPRGVNPDKSMRTGAAGQMQALLVLIYPIAGIPVMLAYGARYAFRSVIAFYIVLLVAAGVGAIVYWVSMESAMARAERDRESIVDRLSQGESMIQA